MIPSKIKIDQLEIKHTISEYKKCSLDLKVNAKKGDGGVLLIIGGSEMYTGAPYYAAKAAFLSGVDLVYILTCESEFSGPATTSLKTLLPECIILPVLSFDLEIHTFILNRVTSVLLGSGMGRPDDFTSDKIVQIMEYIQKRPISIPIVVDGDGIRFVSVFDQIDLKNAVLTPNYNERQHLENLNRDAACILFKEAEDIIASDRWVGKVETQGGFRRCGGIGDVLAGTIASLTNRLPLILSVLHSCMLTREAARMAFKNFEITMSSQDVLDELKKMLSKDCCTVNL
ncbi:putative sugar kinase [Pseudoloma neurophilia]|uniref:ATP-dependent (S)-NAD(P)H-hydrate dehydratase n=1 Tax=Pseudoloma neurophilia TaxID=146866 RepID=A0A0R0LYG3_9MICR|nr:putative sugar kinase [Pseudoloma neurophilia]